MEAPENPTMLPVQLQTPGAVAVAVVMQLQVVQEVVALLFFVLQILLLQQALDMQKQLLAQIKFGHLQATGQ